MTSDIAKVRFVADSSQGSFRGSNPQEQADIDMIRKAYAPYLYSNNPPKAVLKKLAPVADKLLRSATADKGGDIFSLVGMYETP